MKFNWFKAWNPLYIYNYIMFCSYRREIKKAISDWEAVNERIGKMTPMRYNEKTDRLEVYNPLFDAWETHDKFVETMGRDSNFV